MHRWDLALTIDVEQFITGILSPKARDRPLYHLSSLARFVILYAVLYSAFGVISPFLPAYLGDRGLSPQQIALVIGLGTAVRLASGLGDSQTVSEYGAEHCPFARPAREWQRSHMCRLEASGQFCS